MLPVAARIVNDVSICTSVGRAQLVLGKNACGDSFQCLCQKFFLAPAQLVLLLRTLSLPVWFVRNCRLASFASFASFGLLTYDFAIGIVCSQVFQACLRSSLCG